jgi:TonB-dependent SusC/RagA subfamily outer membrane receptor
VPIPAGQHVESVEDMLQGRIPGLQVLRLANGDITLRIRGTNSLLEEGDPLVIIDGMAVTPGNLTPALRGLKPHEIQDIRVLKDVSSTSVYGSAGAHGVILITTKHDR